ncbi:hypothetical protein GLAREA_11201 [Glarea lozoyensis ATCC 20868]|uniref:Uncharacterized protein n=1 Tax=Glarea lozoyensis (strain ATCC 20868 / MF5171) TaxID=1116229 RepID=S3DAL0_GLAL2|nr:uncharacterized protein GLAREA_11201 [Glarea lozoyensis ATCC 20868]EPE35502.1 hypothetical protein GLAREA_11201 [Glarea lozoyensis ATCC 20868]
MKPNKRPLPRTAEEFRERALEIDWARGTNPYYRDLISRLEEEAQAEHMGRQLAGTEDVASDIETDVEDDEDNEVNRDSGAEEDDMKIDEAHPVTEKDTIISLENNTTLGQQHRNSINGMVFEESDEEDDLTFTLGEGDLGDTGNSGRTSWELRKSTDKEMFTGDEEKMLAKMDEVDEDESYESSADGMSFDTPTEE